MEKEFVNYETTLELKELGFDEPCFGYYDHQIKELDTISSDVCERLCKYDTHIKAPTYSQAFRFLREKYKIEATTSCFYSKRLNIPYEERQYHCHVIRDGVTSKGPRYKTYEEAERVCLKKLIEIVKEK